LKVLDGRPVTSRDSGEAQKAFEGKLNHDALKKKIQPFAYEDIQVSLTPLPLHMTAWETLLMMSVLHCV